ncbi:hypothetical protein E1B28_003179 [Marasmius oreades]|uniref:Uncharacterized protein n=1 Tax=Marasmius oreades TaxID=181124 RepID=A0A9P7RLD8_9AGAR|nr:uncharacterized protein E1B28_003179 [Marasmius oreades]KAG7085632.1 hypothetical protein E1B28_003179 [Marasmius oreades]
MKTLNSSQFRSPPIQRSYRRYRPHPYPGPAFLDEEEDQPYALRREDEIWILMMVQAQVDHVHQSEARRRQPEPAFGDDLELRDLVNQMNVMVGILIIHAILSLLIHVKSL